MAGIPYVQRGEYLVGQGHPSLSDVINRPLRSFLESLGIDPDADDSTFLPIIGAGSNGGEIVSAAVMDNSTRADLVIQSELDLGGVSAGNIKTVRLTAGTAKLQRPLLLQYNNQKLVGPSSGTCKVASSGYYGPSVILLPPTATYPIPINVSPLATGDGGSWEFDATSTAFLSLNDIPHARLDGLSAFSLSFFLRLDDLDSTRELFVSYGQRLPYDAATSALRLYVDTSGLVAGYLRVNDVEKSFTIGTIAADQTYHVEFCFDGSTIYPFLDGVLGTTVAAAGTITQGLTEDLIMGRRPRDWPEAGSVFVSQNCRVDGVHFSNVARHTATFTAPTAKPSSDANTLALLNFDETYGPCVVAKTLGSAKAYLVTRREFNAVLLMDQELSGIAIENSLGIGLVACQTIKTRLSDVRVLGGIPWGIARLHNCFSWRWRDVYVLTHADAIAGVWSGQATGAGLQWRTEIEGGRYQLLCSEGADDEYQGLFLGPSSSSIISAIFKGEGSGGHVTCHSMLVDQENLGADWEAAVVFSKIDGFCLIGGDFEGQNQPALIVDDVKRGVIIAPRMTAGGAAVVIDIVTPPASPIQIYEPLQRFGGSIAWTAAADAPYVSINTFGQSQIAIRDAGNSGTSLTLLGTNGKRQKVTMTGNCTFTVTLTDGHEIELHVLTGAGGFTGSFTGVTWAEGSAPTLTATAAKRDVFLLWMTDGVLFGRVIGQNL